jgi:hypothetical protein
MGSGRLLLVPRPAPLQALAEARSRLPQDCNRTKRKTGCRAD